MGTYPSWLTLPSHSLDFPKLSEWLSSVPEVKEWIVQDFLPPGLTLITGAPKWGHKTTFALNLILTAASGNIGPTFKSLRRFKILMLENDGTHEDNRTLITNIARSHSIDPTTLDTHLTFAYMVHKHLLDRSFVRDLWAKMVAENYDILVLDPLAMFLGGDENSTPDMTRAIESILYFKAANKSVILIHHLRDKDHGRSADLRLIDASMRGSSVLAGAYDCHLALRDSQPFSTDRNSLIRILKRGPYARWNIQWHFDEIKGTIACSLTETDLYGKSPETIDTSHKQSYRWAPQKSSV